jgi:hypothetical protein
MPVSTRLERQGAAGRSDKAPKPSSRASDRTAGPFVDPGLEIRVADRVTLGGFESRPIFLQVIEISARENLRVGKARDAAIEIGLAEEAAIDRIA